MKLKVLYDCSGSMSEKKSIIFYVFYTINNIKEEYGLDIEQYIWNEEIINFNEPKDLKFGKNLKFEKLKEILDFEDTKMLIITDGCFSFSIRNEFESISNYGLEFLLVGEDCNAQVVKKICQKDALKIENLMTCLNSMFSGAFL